MKNLEFIADIRDGFIVPHKEVAYFIKNNEGKQVRITLSENLKKRSLKQNNYWFSILDEYVIPKFREGGSNWSSYKLHCHLMHELGYEEALVDPNGTIVPSRIESHTFGTKAWEEYMERARAYIAQEYNIYLPLPNEEMECQNE